MTLEPPQSNAARSARRATTVLLLLATVWTLVAVVRGVAAGALPVDAPLAAEAE